MNRHSVKKLFIHRNVSQEQKIVMLNIIDSCHELYWLAKETQLGRFEQKFDIDRVVKFFHDTDLKTFSNGKWTI